MWCSVIPWPRRPTAFEPARRRRLQRRLARSKMITGCEGGRRTKSLWCDCTRLGAYYTLLLLWLRMTDDVHSADSQRYTFLAESVAMTASKNNSVEQRPVVAHLGRRFCNNHPGRKGTLRQVLSQKRPQVHPHSQSTCMLQSTAAGARSVWY